MRENLLTKLSWVSQEKGGLWRYIPIDLNQGADKMVKGLSSITFFGEFLLRFSIFGFDYSGRCGIVSGNHILGVHSLSSPFISSLLILFYTYIYEGSLFLLCSCVFSVYNSIWVSCRIGYIFQTLNWEIIVWWWQGTSFWCRSICRLITIIWWLIMLLQL